MARRFFCNPARGLGANARAWVLVAAAATAFPAEAAAADGHAPPPTAAAPLPKVLQPKGTPSGRSGTKGARVTRGVDAAARRAIAGGPTADEASMGAESPELRALREA